MSRPLKRREFVTLLKIFITRWVAKILLLFVFDFKWFILENIWFIFATLQIQNMWNASCDLFLFCSIHTVRKSQIFSKNSIFRKTITNYEFEFSCQKWMDFQLLWILYLKKIIIFGAKIQIILEFGLHKHDFLTRKFKLSWILYFKKSQFLARKFYTLKNMIFGAKIQNNLDFVQSKIKICGAKIQIILDSVLSKSQDLWREHSNYFVNNSNLQFWSFLKIEFLNIIRDFLTVCVQVDLVPKIGVITFRRRQLFSQCCWQLSYFSVSSNKSFSVPKKMMSYSRIMLTLDFGTWKCF